MSYSMTDVVSTLRRRIGDTSTTPTYDDSTLEGYISDATAEVELDYFRGFEVNYGLFNMPLGKLDVQIFAIRAHYLIVLSEKSTADRNNFLMKKGRLTLDNTGQAKDHAETLASILVEYRRALYMIKNGGQSITGIRME